MGAQTLEAVARRRWAQGQQRVRRCGYPTIEKATAFERVMHFVRGPEALSLDSSSDLEIFDRSLAAAARCEPRSELPNDAAMREALARIDAQLPARRASMTSESRPSPRVGPPGLRLAGACGRPGVPWLRSDTAS